MRPDTVRVPDRARRIDAVLEALRRYAAAREPDRRAVVNRRGAVRRSVVRSPKIR